MCSLTVTVHSVVSIFDVAKINKFKFEIDLKILSALDDKEYGLIIGLSDIIKHGLPNKLASQFIDHKLRTNMRELQSVSIGENFDGYSESDKFANLPPNRGIVNVEGGLQSSTSSSTHTWIPFNSAQANTKVLRHEDMLNTALESFDSTSQRSLTNQNRRYGEDDEVRQFNYCMKFGKRMAIILRIIMRKI